MSSRVLRNAVLLEDGFEVTAEQPRRLSTLAGDTFSDAYDRGKRDGYTEGRRAADEAALLLGRQVSEAFDRALNELRMLQHERTSFLVSEAIAIAEFLIGRDMSSTAEALVPRIQQALAAIDDAPLTLHLCPSDQEIVEQGIGSNPNLSTEVDPSLQPGEARISGPWVEADVTMQAAVEAVREALL